jgi:hypothetical protein
MRSSDVLDIRLDSDEVIFRSIPGHDDAQAVVLSGSLLVSLAERTDIRDIVLIFTGK